METADLYHGESVYYGWTVGTHTQFHLVPYTYLSTTTRGDFVLENKDNGAVFLAKIIRRCSDV